MPVRIEDVRRQHRQGVDDRRLRRVAQQRVELHDDDDDAEGFAHKKGDVAGEHLGRALGDRALVCLDTGHHSYAGFDPVAFMRRHIGRISYMHFKDIDPTVKARAIAGRTGFYDACAQGIFCNLGKGDVDFAGVRQVLLDAGFEGWCTVEQDCDPAGPTSPVDDARANRAYLASIGF